MLVQNGVEYGLIGMVLLVAAIVLSFKSMPAVRQESPLLGMRESLIGGLLALCVAGLFVDLTTAKIFWLALSLIALVRNAAMQQLDAPREAAA
jgi:hypothetical protein